MFDPLDFISGPENGYSDRAENNKLTTPWISKNSDNSADESLAIYESDDDVDVPIQVIDLPVVSMANSVVILTILLLLRPSQGVNFKKTTVQDDIEGGSHLDSRLKEIPGEYLEETVKWYKSFGHSRLDTVKKICTCMPQLATTASVKDLLGYYTTVLARFSRPGSLDQISTRILKEASLRISEKCGRTAQPAMTRVFQVDGLQTPIKLHEPALTADNLGLKTWGASLVLARKLCQSVQKFTSARKSLKILELGAGTGLVGIALIKKLLEASREQSHSFFLTDLPEIVPNLHKNMELNNCDRNSNMPAEAAVLDWTNPSGFQKVHGYGKYDVLLIADPLYSPQHPQWIVDMIDEFLDLQGVVYLCIPVRDKYVNERQQLWDLLAKFDLHIVSAEADEGIDDWGKVSYLYKEIVRSCGVSTKCKNC
ncbi:LADA_0E01618g1_1 [Lachancea dasiensis]|uniref:LADA_0E01618g1_1 n=1 Tax=Lachancea dasiensis TaxID=1072105 RepID=A0A1G4JB52_9SACH|nr:LADA_0E01618g1_1 [Lachancea dasiensis]